MAWRISTSEAPLRLLHRERYREQWRRYVKVSSLHCVHRSALPVRQYTLSHHVRSWRLPRRSNVSPFDVRRTFGSDVITNIIIPPAVFAGLLLSLWFYKCCMMVIFQNKIIYMPSVPPFSRRERISDYASSCEPIKWESETITSLDGTKLSLCIGSADKGDHRIANNPRRLLVLYFQGNASSIPPRLPSLSSVMKKTNSAEVDCTLVALSYRGFWTSQGKASESGIERDAVAALQWVHNNYNGFGKGVKLVLWGQSIGAGVATRLAAISASEAQPFSDIDALILETPFTRIRDMLVALYPQKWLPYRYLHPFLRNHWDSVSALRTLRERDRNPRVLIVTAEKDEVVPSEQGNELVRLCKESGLNTQHENILGAFHTNAVIKSQGQVLVAKFLQDVSLQDKA